ncbi:MAG: 30S ribosome-binding factor RbfA [Lachnospiraceae bacterium]|nr:30S ribosome-binding factor RbfA [Lachnospiraceae bacterium]MBR5666801.1 30S ribosome-binding factor RbfA [Lachnospiraceae bacterium]
MRKNSIKNTRINQEVQKELSSLILLEVKDPRIAPMTSVSDVEVAPDLKSAKVFISVLGDEEVKKETLKGLKSAAPFLRSCLAKSMNMRNTPELRFVLDESFEYGMHMNELLASLHISDEEEEKEEEEDGNG